MFDITLLRRERSGNPYLLAHEIDELLPLLGEDRWAEDRFPFTLAGNIKVPFDILLRLGVDIFRDLTFDTWVIQTVLRRLLLSVVPWDMHRRAGSDRIDGSHGKIIEEVEAQIQKMNRDANYLQQYNPSFRDLYLFPGFAMFNHSCDSHSNADWGFDNVIPNRIVVWALRPIAKGEEVRIRYRSKQISQDAALRLLGRNCECTLCAESSPNSSSVDHGESVHISSSSDLPERGSDPNADDERTSEESVKPVRGASRRSSSVKGKETKGLNSQAGKRQAKEKGKTPETGPPEKAKEWKRARFSDDDDGDENDNQPPAKREKKGKRAQVLDNEDCYESENEPPVRRPKKSKRVRIIEDDSDNELPAGRAKEPKRAQVFENKHEDEDEHQKRNRVPPTKRERYKNVNRSPPPAGGQKDLMRPYLLQVRERGQRWLKNRSRSRSLQRAGKKSKTKTLKRRGKQEGKGRRGSEKVRRNQLLIVHSFIILARNCCPWMVIFHFSAIIELSSSLISVLQVNAIN